ncbi:MAG: sulfotransferase [Nocardioides sp.]
MGNEIGGAADGGPRWVFVGGTGRSGTSITAEALARTGAVTYVPTELRFHVDPGGLLDLANGDVPLKKFRQRMLGPWFERSLRDGSTRGISRYITREAVQEVLDAPQPLAEGPRRAAARIWNELTTAMFGDGRIVEMTPPTMMRADELSRMLDHRALMINVVRDGRDVAFSLVRRRWGPDDAVTGLHWWANRIRRADQALRLCRAPALTVQLAELADETARGAWAARLSEHLGGVSEGDMAAALSILSPAELKSGRWRSEAPVELRATVDRVYSELWRELRADGVTGLPHPPDD